MFARIFLLAALLFAAGEAWAQPVTVIGPVTPGNCAAFNSQTVIKDGGACGGGGGAVSSVSNADGSLTISPTTGAVVGSINLAHTNKFSVEQDVNLSSSGVVPTTQFGGVGLRVIGPDGGGGQGGRFLLDSFQVQALWTCTFANNNAAAPSTPTINQNMCQYNTLGFTGSSPLYTLGARFGTYAAENWSSTNHGTFITLGTTPTGAGQITNDGWELGPSGGVVMPSVTGANPPTGLDKGAGTQNISTGYYIQGAPFLAVSALGYGMATGNTAAANATALGNACAAWPTVYIPAGTYNIQSPTLTGCAHVFGDGIGQTKLVAAGSPSGAVLLFNGNATVLVENLEVDVTIGSFPTVSGIVCQNNTQCVMRNVLGQGQIGLYCTGVANCLIENSQVTSFAQYGIRAAGPGAATVLNSKLSHNTVSGPGASSSHYLACDFHDYCNVEFNKVTRTLPPNPSGFGVETTDMNDVKVVGNTIIGGSDECINATFSSTAFARGIITNNICRFDANAADYGISFDANNGANNIIKMLVEGNVIDGPGKSCIALVQGVNNSIVTGNLCISPNANNAFSPTYGILLQGSATTNNAVFGNVFQDIAGHMTAQVGETNDGTGNPNNNSVGANAGSRGTGATAVVLLGAGSQWVDLYDAWLNYTPTITCNTGAVGAYSAQGGRFKLLGGRAVSFQAFVQAAAGSCVAPITINTPFTINTTAQPIAAGRDGTTGKMLQGLGGGVTNTGYQIQVYDGTTPTVSDLFYISSTFERN